MASRSVEIPGDRGDQEIERVADFQCLRCATEKKAQKQAIVQIIVQGLRRMKGK